MRADFKQKSFIEGYFNRIFKGLSFEEFGLDLPAVKEVVEVEQIENYKKPLLMLLLEDETILHIEFINDKIKPNIESMMIYDANICIKYGIQVTTVILYSGSEQKEKLKTDSGSIHYEAQIICLSEFNGEEIYILITEPYNKKEVILETSIAEFLVLRDLVFCNYLLPHLREELRPSIRKTYKDFYDYIESILKMLERDEEKAYWDYIKNYRIKGCILH